MEYPAFKEEIRKLTGIDLNLYKEKQMKRRIETLIDRLGLKGYASYVERLKRDLPALEYFLGYITIHVTEFFRTPEHWSCLETQVMPQFRKPLIWSVACSSGEEPYSLVMSMAEYVPLQDIQVLATDIDEKMLQKASRGIYTVKEVEKVPERYVSKYFEKVPGGYRVKKEVRERVSFAQMDLLQVSDYPRNCDLIVCRNVLIYFTDEGKDRLYTEFHRSLKAGGYLFTGNTEQLLQYKALGFQKEKNFLYRKVSPPTPQGGGAP